ncbi:hypothetical protein FGG08_002395 [Glutinoglossum americanum]|uniref:Uncharacterized protein n=1 Tax=Glutinoglossum americanum TaxID=1670608 RepID=A0A9P8L4H1_9PEZI|nr:hypothetical protein FGG08_002395 [Glutinoglossum americanum]
MGQERDMAEEMMDQMMVPRPLQIRKRSVPTDIEEWSDINHQLFQGCYWQSESWQRFKDMGDSSVVSSVGGSSLHIDVQDSNPEFIGSDRRQILTDVGGPSPHAGVRDSNPEFVNMGGPSLHNSAQGSGPEFKDVGSPPLRIDSHLEFVGMDLEPLWRVRAGIFADEKSSEYVETASRASSKTALGMLIGKVKASQEVDFPARDTEGKAFDGITQRQPHGKPSNHISWYIRFLSDIETHQQNTTGSTGVALRGIPYILSNPRLIDPWLREQMRNKWKKMHKVTLAPQRAEMRLRMRKAGSATDRQAIAAEKGRLMRQALKEVAADQTSEIALALRNTLEAPAQEITTLYRLLQTQHRHLLHLTLHPAPLPPLLHAYAPHQTSLTRALALAHLPFLSQLDAIDSLLDVGLRTLAAMTTRVGRVAAKDVRDPARRGGEARGRLERDPAGAAGYLAKVAGDLAFLRLWARTVGEGFGDLAAELEGFGGRAVDLYVLAEAAGGLLDGGCGG